MKISFSVEFFVVVFFPEFVSWDCGGGSAVTLGDAPWGLWCLCICITAPHYFSFPNINICVQISPLPASELLMGLWAPLKCILATLLYRTHRPHLDAASCINLPAGYFRISCSIIASTYHVFGAVLCNIMKRALKCRFWPRVENLSLVTYVLFTAHPPFTSTFLWYDMTIYQT